MRIGYGLYSVSPLNRGPRFVYQNQPGEDNLTGVSRSHGSGSTQQPSIEIKTPKGLLPKVEISRSLGYAEYQDPDAIPSVQELGGYHVQKISTPSGFWARKPSLLDGEDFLDSALEVMRHDLLMRKILQKYFPMIVVPEAMSYVNEVYNLKLLSRFIESEEVTPKDSSVNAELQAEKEFVAKMQKFKELVAIVCLCFGGRDIRRVNVRWLKENPVFVDWGMVEKEAHDFYVSDARHLIGVREAPFVNNFEGNNDLNSYMEVFDAWRGEHPKLLDELQLFIEEVGLTDVQAKTYMDAVKTNLANYVLNINTFVALANGTLPKHVLKELSWKGNPEPKTTTSVPDEGLEVDLPEHGQLLVELGEGNLLLVELTNDSGNFRVQGLDGHGIQGEKIIAKSDLIVGTSANNDYVLKQQSLAKQHLKIQRLESRRVRIVPLNPDFANTIWE